jgi:REP element-mobilizing transposase RayT
VFPGAAYHVTSRGDRRESIYQDDADRTAQLEIIGQAMDRFDAKVLAYCLMSNHCHLVLHTREGNLSRLMRHVNGVYTQAYNRRHGLVGHLLQGRFKAILVDRDAYLMALCRYVERNPVAVKMVRQAGDWPWSSYAAHVGQVAARQWLDSDGPHGYLLRRPADHARDRACACACQRFAALVAQSDSRDADFWSEALHGQIFLGDEAFAERMQALAQPQRAAARETPRAQRRLHSATWQALLARAGGGRNRALVSGYREGGMTMTALAAHAALSVSMVSRVVAGAEKASSVGRHQPRQPGRHGREAGGGAQAAAGDDVGGEQHQAQQHAHGVRVPVGAGAVGCRVRHAQRAARVGERGGHHCSRPAVGGRRAC